MTNTQDTAPRLGCGLEGLESLPAGSVGMILSDIPSGETKGPFDKAPDLDRFWNASWSALRPGGNVVVMASSIRFAELVIQSQRSAFRYDLVWRKSIATGFLNAAHRPLRQHEFVLVFWRDGRGTYNPQMRETGVPISYNVRRGVESVNRDYSSTNYGRGTSGARSRAGATDRYPTSVLDFHSVPSRSKERVHHQQKPVPLLRYLIETYSEPGELVADPFAGSASSGLAAVECGRRFCGWDINPVFGRAP